ncbi:MAG TPA: DNA repair protein RecN, partial [Solirubrobacteraceae bacterium]|nr:DNA repair protein RecN [Solirubrobacteraceae bacterium]
MIDELHISGLGVIEDATLELAHGLTVITGETGAGKTMVVTALELLLGSRAQGSLVRAGARAAVVEARVVPAPPGAAEWLDDDTTEVVVSREVPAPGESGETRSRARINGRLAPANALATLLGELVEVHGQGEQLRLSRPQVQRKLLDRHAGEPHGQTVARYRSVHADWRDAVARREQVTANARERAREIDRLRHEIGEIEGAQLDPARDAVLDSELERLDHVEQLTLAAAEAAVALGDDGARTPVGAAVQALRRAVGHDPALDALATRAESVATEVTDLLAELRAYGDATATEPARAEELRQRRRQVRDLERKYGDGVEAILAYLEQARQDLEALEAEDADATELDQRVGALGREVLDLAADLHTSRATAAASLSTAIAGHLEDLGMPHARVEIAVVATGRLGADGADDVTFLFAANPGEQLRPLATAASGGERSRLCLAVEVALADHEDIEVLVFDEVDAGVGGAAAVAVGEKLARLAEGRQVLCVTHLAQIAAFADVHHVIEKGIDGGRAVTTTRVVSESDRASELARMLSGNPGGASALEHARELLRDAQARLGRPAAPRD